MKTGTTNGPLWGHRAEEWASLQEPQCAAAFEAVLDRLNLRPGAAFFDAGCGAGLAAQMAASRGARVAGLDASEEMLQIARRRTPAGDFRQGDLEELPFPDASFDAVTAFNSLQFAGDPLAALAEARRVAKPGASVAILTWAPPEGMPAASIVASLRPLLPPPPPGSPGVFALSNQSALRDLAARAGLQPAGLLPIDCPWQFPDLDTALRALKSAGVTTRVLEYATEAEVDAAFTAALAPFLQAGGSYRVGAGFQCLFAARAEAGAV